MLILASQSKDRKKMIASLHIPFNIITADIDEQSIRHHDFGKQAKMIARAKADKVKIDYPDAVIIAADTFAVYQNKILEKPKNLDDARKMVKLQSGCQEEVYTGYCYLDPNKKIDQSGSTKTLVKFREFRDDEINAYINKFPVTDWSAGFSPFHHPYIIGMIAELHGSVTSVSNGLPMEILIPLLKISGFKIKP